MPVSDGASADIEESRAQPNPEAETDHPPRGWDRDAFWYPTLDRRGGLLGLAVVLFVLHFDELFGVYANSTLLFGWLPINLGYHIFMGVLHVGFMYLLYLNWPSADLPESEGEPTERETVTDATAGTGGGD